MSIRKLEDRLQKRLLNRTSRSVSLTEIGERLLPHMRDVLADYQTAIEASSEPDTPTGLIRVHMRAAVYQVLLDQILGRFFEKYPRIRIEIHTDTLDGDLVAGRFDLGIGLPPSIPLDMIAARVTEDLPVVLVGSPVYLAAHGYPQNPHDLESHVFVRFRDEQGKVLPFWFVNGSTAIQINAPGRLVLNHFTAMIRAAVDGIGLTRTPLLYVKQHIEEGRLVEILPEYTYSIQGYHVYYSSRRHLPTHVRAFVDFLKANFEINSNKTA